MNSANLVIGYSLLNIGYSALLFYPQKSVKIHKNSLYLGPFFSRKKAQNSQKFPSECSEDIEQYM